jgi:hypothetical protein
MHSASQCSHALKNVVLPTRVPVVGESFANEIVLLNPSTEDCKVRISLDAAGFNKDPKDAHEGLTKLPCCRPILCRPTRHYGSRSTRYWPRSSKPASARRAGWRRHWPPGNDRTGWHLQQKGQEDAPSRGEKRKSVPVYRSIEMSKLSRCISIEASAEGRRACMPSESVKGGAGGNLGG